MKKEIMCRMDSRIVLLGSTWHCKSSIVIQQPCAVSKKHKLVSRTKITGGTMGQGEGKKLSFQGKHSPLYLDRSDVEMCPMYSHTK
jgi:hypothetical protein